MDLLSVFYNGGNDYQRIVEMFAEISGQRIRLSTCNYHTIAKVSLMMIWRKCKKWFLSSPVSNNNIKYIFLMWVIEDECDFIVAPIVI